MKKSHKFAIAGGVVFVAIIFLVYTAVQQSSELYINVSELLAKGESVAGKTLKASGKVKDGTIKYDSVKLILDFDIFDEGTPEKTLHVNYKGIRPDAFKEGVEVIITGKFDTAQSTFNATVLLVKCPSRYEGKTPPEGYKHGEEGIKASEGTQAFGTKTSFEGKTSIPPVSVIDEKSKEVKKK